MYVFLFDYYRHLFHLFCLQDDCELNRRGQTALQKLKLLPLVDKQIKKVHLREGLLDAGILSAITDWLTRLPDGNLPHLQIREKLLQSLIDVCTLKISY